MEFRIVNLVGIVFQRDGDFLLLDEEKGEVNLSGELRTMIGGKVQVMLHHAPQDPPDRSRWGGGSCMWQSSGKCPAGHHDRPGYLYGEQKKGELTERDGSFHVADSPLYLSFLDGHRCRVTVVPSVDPGDIPELMGDMNSNNLSELMARAEKLKAFIAAADKAGKK